MNFIKIRLVIFALHVSAHGQADQRATNDKKDYDKKNFIWFTIRVLQYVKIFKYNNIKIDMFIIHFVTHSIIIYLYLK